MNELGFVWEMQKRFPWETHFAELVAYKERNGNCNVSRSDAANRNLGIWVGLQRTEYKDGKLSEERISQLNELGFVWKLRNNDEFWKTSYNNLVAYKAEHGHCFVSQKDEANKSLYNWVQTMRAAFKNGKLSEERIAYLNRLEFAWEVGQNDALWETRYNELVAYKAEHGDCNVPATYKTNPSLGNWTADNVLHLKMGGCPRSVFSRLNALGFVWGMQESDLWEMHFDKLV